MVSKLVLTGAAAAMTLTTLAAPAHASTEVTVTPADLGGSWHTGDSRPDGTLTFADTYGGASGAGAAVLNTPSSSAKVQLLTDEHDGTFLRDITQMGFSTYQAEVPAGSPATPAINIRLDRDNNGLVDAYLVYEPYQDNAFYGNAAIQAGVWQNWDAWHDGDSEWWSGQIAGCPQATPCTIDQLLGLYPDAVIQEDPASLRSGSTPADADFNGSFGLNQGSGNAGVLAAADNLRIATSGGVDVTYNFEAAIVLNSAEDCKQGGWAASTSPAFTNQGQCVSYFARQR